MLFIFNSITSTLRETTRMSRHLEQMPNLLNFLEGNGAFITREHTPLKSHTADDIITSLTGVYGDQHGMPVANGFGWFNPPGSKYFDGLCELVPVLDRYRQHQDRPELFYGYADWKERSRSLGALDARGLQCWEQSPRQIWSWKMSLVISPRCLLPIPHGWRQRRPKLTATIIKRAADHEGIAIHCAKGSPVCSNTNGGEPDLLPQEPGGYNGFNALYGNIFVAPVISPGTPLVDLDGIVMNDDRGRLGSLDSAEISAVNHWLMWQGCCGTAFR